jgi:hypothetical protein
MGRLYGQARYSNKLKCSLGLESLAKRRSLLRWIFAIVPGWKPELL